MPREPPACARCGTPLPEPIAQPLSVCPRCGASHAARAVVVESLSVRKVAGVARRRYQIRAREGGDDLVFEGPPGLAADPGQTITLLSSEGRPVWAATIAGAFALGTAASDAVEIRRVSTLRRALLGIAWLLLIAALVFVAALCDRGTRPLGAPEPRIEGKTGP